MPHLQARYGLTTDRMVEALASASAAAGSSMRITAIETYTVGAGWKNWLFVKRATPTPGSTGSARGR